MMKLWAILCGKGCRNTAVLWLILFGFVSILKADPVDVEKARSVALTQLRNVTGDNVGLRSATSLDLVYEPKNEANHPYFYVFNGGKGFVIVSGDDRATPILGYSDEGSFDPDNIPPNMAEFLKGYEKEMDYIKNSVSVNNSDLKTEWQTLRSGDVTVSESISKRESKSLLKNVSKRSYIVGDYLIKTNWDQGSNIYPYNALCPYDTVAQKRTVTGCVATAMAQIMRYWGTDRGVASVCQGSNSYICGNNYDVYADFENTVYDYTKMPEMIDYASTEEKEMIALLSYHCGVAANMNYGINASGTNIIKAKYGFENYLGFNAHYVKPAVNHFRDSTAESNIAYEAWIYTIKSEIDDLRPVLYIAAGDGGGEGHTWVCDGYNEDDFFHMNWGYGGRTDKVWCKLSLMSFNVYANTYTYYYGHGALIHIYPRNIPDKIVYVTPDGTGDGSSWENATYDLYTEMKKERPAPTQVWVKKGIYYGNTSDTVAFVLGNGVKVYGGFNGTEQNISERIFNSNNVSVLDGQSVRKVLDYKADNVIKYASVDGFTIRNGKNPAGNGGGVYLGMNGKIKNCIIKNCVALYGGGIYKYGEGEVENCSFENNKAVCGGGFFGESYSYEIALKNCQVEFNIADSCGGGVYITDNTTLSVNDSTNIKNNEAFYFGGGIYSFGRINMESGDISSNKANTGGGIYFAGVYQNYMNNGIISNNEAIVGAGIMVNGPTINLNGGVITSNNSDERGGGIYCNGMLIIPRGSAIVIKSNSAGENGGGIYLNHGLALINGGTIGVDLDESPVDKNDAINKGGNYAYNGAGLYANSNSLYINFNEAENVVIGGNYAEHMGGGIYTQAGYNLLNEGLIICNNTASVGGGVYIVDSRNGNSILDGCIIKNNKAVNNGGGIFNEITYGRYLYVNNATIIDNMAKKGGGIYNIGSFNMSAGLISSNTAGEGGGIYNEGSKYYTFSMSGGEISGNTANFGPGIYNYQGGNYSLSNTINISDIIYSYNVVNILMGGHNITHFGINALTYHTDYTKPLTMQLKNPDNSQFSILARYSTSEAAAEAVNNGVFVIANYGWRPVAVGTDVKIESYTPPVVAENVIHVTPEGAGKKDGSSWDNATPDLYSEIKKDRTDSVQIWVKEGVYYGDTLVGQGRNLAAFILGKRNKIYGGFAGNESTLYTRAHNNPSILDGRNSRRVICQLTDFSDSDSSFLDGFTIQNGLDTIIGTANIDRANQSGVDMTGNGGGAYLRMNGILKNCIIENCKAKSGGGVFNYGGKIIDCSFNNNIAEHAGGLFNYGSALLGNCIIYNNTTTNLIGYGGGVYNMGNLHIFDGALINNNKGVIGNGLYTHANGITTMSGGEISDNKVGQIGMGGGIYSDGCVIIYNGNIVNNQAGGGGGITSHGTLTLYGGSISDNTSTSYGGGIYNGGTLNIEDASVTISGNLAYSYGGGIASMHGNLNISAATIGVMTNIAPENPEEALAMGGNVALSSDGGGGIYVYNITNNNTFSFTNSGAGNIIIGGNYAHNYGGGVYVTSVSGFALPSNVSICGNTSSVSGGALYTSSSNINILLNGCNISYNKSLMNGGGIFSRSYLDMTDGRITHNEAVNYGGAIWNMGTFNFSGGEISENTANLGDGIYNDSKVYITDSAKVKDITYVPGSSYAVNLGNLTYHTDHTKPVTVQGRIGNYAVISSLAQYYVSQGILIATPGLYPAVSNNYVYLYSDGTRSMELNSVTDNEFVSSEKISVYPTLINSGGTLTIVSPGGGTASVWNLSGMMVGQHKLVEGKTQVSISCPAGNYVVKVKTDAGEEKVVKIIVK